MTLDQLHKDIHGFFKGIKTGDVYKPSANRVHIPKNEDGLQLDLYIYLKDHGYDVVYELELPDLADKIQYTANDPLKVFASQGSLIPDLVVKLSDESLVCIELKYNETDINAYKHDGRKCKTYVENCTDVHFAGCINLLKGSLAGLNANSCLDPEYNYHYYYWFDLSVDEEGGLSKSDDHYPILELWERRLQTIKEGKGKFHIYDEHLY